MTCWRAGCMGAAARASRLIDCRPGWRRAKADEAFGSDAHRWLRTAGLLHATGAGLFDLSPLLLRSLRKLERLVDEALAAAGAHRIHCGSLGTKASWDASGRWDLLSADMFTLKDRSGVKFCLQPTHEEAVTSMVAASAPIPQHQLPICLYQITDKFRDELSPRHGLLRARVFRMNDLYTFDANEQAAAATYGCVAQIYDHIFRRMSRLPVLRVSAASGSMGGSLSHEYHLESTAGQDRLLYCRQCESGYNAELQAAGRQLELDKCDGCGRPFDQIQSYEIAHTFVLGTGYSQAFGAVYQPDDASVSPLPLHACCYGIGTTRLLAAALDWRTTDRRLVWPKPIAPYTVCVVPPKRGSKEDRQGAGELAADVADGLNADVDGVKNDVILDDRTGLTIGRRVVQAKQMGYPFVLVAGRSACASPRPLFELIRTGVDDHHDVVELVTHAQAFDFFRRRLWQE